MKLCHLVCLLTFVSGISGARLTVSPSQITIGGPSPTSQLTVSCTPDAPGITQVYNIEIGKKSSTGSKQPIIQIGNTDSSVQVVDTSLQQRMTASGSISGATGSIQFILTDLRCTDAASTYYCSTVYLAGSAGAGSDESTTNITARTYPENVEMFPSPDNTQDVVGQLLSIRCTARIGNQFDVNNLQNLWTWEYRSIDNDFPSWTRYPNDQNITYETPASAADCQYTGASTLKHTVSTQDNRRQFRCSVLSSDYSDIKTVYVDEEYSTTPTISEDHDHALKETGNSWMCEAGAQTDRTMSDIHKMCENLKCKPEKLDGKETLFRDLFVEHIVKDDEHRRFYTGLFCLLLATCIFTTPFQSFRERARPLNQSFHEMAGNGSPFVKWLISQSDCNI